jgi:hypothetical protein
VRVLVNKLLDWHGAPIILGRGKTHVVTYADILRDLEPLNEGRDKRDRITYDSLWVHAKRYYDLARGSGLLESPDAQGADESARGITGVAPIGSPRTSTNKYEESLARSYLQFETIWCAVDPALCPA